MAPFNVVIFLWCFITCIGTLALPVLHKQRPAFDVSRTLFSKRLDGAGGIPTSASQQPGGVSGAPGEGLQFRYASCEVSQTCGSLSSDCSENNSCQTGIPWSSNSLSIAQSASPQSFGEGVMVSWDGTQFCVQYTAVRTVNEDTQYFPMNGCLNSPQAGDQLELPYLYEQVSSEGSYATRSITFYIQMEGQGAAAH
ncbi:hypothetical protein HDU85_001503 [Gaertneriomyces sp. JEL0708]|nr:hypothetical protein HDU85_001503 [Gaertneriomyces sp. JEL0708]